MNLFAKLLLATLLIALTVPAQAQTAAPLSPVQIARQIKPLAHKTLILVFDVTESTRHGGVFTQEREAAATLLRQGCSPGDRAILLPFGTGYTTAFDEKITDSAGVDALIDKLPAAPSPGHGTNIRWPHHEALKRIARDNLCPAVVVLVTDSFNDRPDLTDPNYPKYRDYYTLKSLTDYPDTSENRDYERLLQTLTAKGCLHQYGVGVAIASTGRPVERLPVGPSQGDDAAGNTTEAPTVLAPTGGRAKSSLLPLLLGILLGLALLALVLWLLLRGRTTPVRLKLGERGLPRDFRLPPGGRLALGGQPGTSPGYFDVFPLAGLPAPLASIASERGGLMLSPTPPAEGAAAPALFHNGMRLEQPAPLRVGDELRVLVPATATDAEREHRVRVEDPRAPLF